MSVSEPGIGTTTYTAEGGAQTPTGYIAPAVPKVRDTTTGQWTAPQPQPQPRTGQRDAPPLTPRRDVPDRDPTVRQQKAISEALGLSLEEVQAMPLVEAKRLYGIQQKTQDAAQWQKEYEIWKANQQDPPSGFQPPQMPSWWYDSTDPNDPFGKDDNNFVHILNQITDQSPTATQGMKDQYAIWTDPNHEYAASYAPIVSMYNRFKAGTLSGPELNWFTKNFPTDKITNVQTPTDPPPGDDDDDVWTPPEFPSWWTKDGTEDDPFGKNDNSFIYILNRVAAGIATPEQQAQYNKWADPNSDYAAVFGQLIDLFNQYKEDPSQIPEAQRKWFESNFPTDQIGADYSTPTPETPKRLKSLADVAPIGGKFGEHVSRLEQMSTGQTTPTSVMTASKLGTAADTITADTEKLTGDYGDIALDSTVGSYTKDIDRTHYARPVGMAKGIWGGEQAEGIDKATVSETPTVQAADDVTSLTREASPEELATLRERAQAVGRDITQEEFARAGRTEYNISDDAKVQQVDFRQATSVAATQEDEISTREAITSTAATSENAQQIVDTFGFGSTRKQIMDSLKASTANAAASNLAQNSNLSQQAASTVVSNPGALDVTEPAIVAAVAELPEEALVSGQMDKLLEGLEDNKVPAWAKPAVDAVDAIMVQRGLQSSSVGRDSLFNAIIQSAFPIAQANAQALQTRAAQNLTNQQQSLIQENQIAADFLSKNAAFKQQMELANLTNEQQMKLANLSARNQTESENLTAEQQTDLANLNARMQTNLLQAQLAEKMGVAQLNVDQQRAVQNAGMVANLDMAQFNADQQVELANSKFMQTMTLTDFNAEQQAAMQNATALASLDMATIDQRTKVAAQNAQSFLQLDMANLSNEQQAAMLEAQQIQQRVLSNQSFDNAAQQFNATSQNQLNQFMNNMEAQIRLQNTAQTNAMRQFNSNQELKADQINNANAIQMQQFNNQMEYQADQWNAANAQAVEQSNVEWRRKANTIDTAAQNQANQINVQNAFNMQSSALAQVWQQLRDAATHAIQISKDDKDRSARIVENAMANTELMDSPADAHHAATAIMWLIRNINKNVFMVPKPGGPTNVELY